MRTEPTVNDLPGQFAKHFTKDTQKAEEQGYDEW